MVSARETYTTPVIVEGRRFDHLHFILTNPHEISQYGVSNTSVIWVNATTIHPSTEYDNSCILKQGDHPWISHDSYIIYDKARVVLLDEINEGIQKKLFFPQELASEALMLRIIMGLHSSDFTRPIIKRTYLNAIKFGHV